MKETARTAALQALLQIEQNEGYSNIVLDQTLQEAGLDRRDAALASVLFYGVLEKRLTLDWYLRRCLSDPRKKLDKTVLTALRCGAYQIFYLDRVPDSAAVNEAVNAVKGMGKASSAGLVNGVLRNLIRQKDSLRLPEGDSPRDWSLRYSVPEQLILLWKKAYGAEIALRLLEAFQRKPGLYLRVNSLKTTPEELKASLEADGMLLTPLEVPAGAALLENCGSPAALPQFQRGLCHVQDLSAQWVCELLDPRPGETVCDCCAAPGGKTFTLAQRMEGTGRVCALDLYPGRVGLIAGGAKRLGLQNVETRVNDAVKGFEGLPEMDRMLCDVPCSGFGVIRRKPEIRYKNVSSLEELPTLQYGILKNASRIVKRGGLLVYSTCTLNPAENSGVAERFLRENSGFEPVRIELSGIQRVVDEPSHMLTMMPFSGASDGFFAAAFRRK